MKSMIFVFELLDAFQQVDLFVGNPSLALAKERENWSFVSREKTLLVLLVDRSDVRRGDARGRARSERNGHFSTEIRMDDERDSARFLTSSPTDGLVRLFGHRTRLLHSRKITLIVLGETRIRWSSRDVFLSRARKIPLCTIHSKSSQTFNQYSFHMLLHISQFVFLCFSLSLARFLVDCTRLTTTNCV